MRRVVVERGWEAFRAEARRLLAAEVPPVSVAWEEARAAQPLLAALETGAGPGLEKSAARTASSAALPEAPREARVPRPFLALAETVSFHRDPARLPRLYEALWRLTHGEPDLLERAAEPLVLGLRRMATDVDHDVHHVHAYVRFRRIERDGQEHWIAWHRPEHPCLRRATWLFERRFGTMRWSILTPDESAHWDGTAVRFGPGAPRSAAPDGDALEQLWLTYYASVFNPARANRELLRAQLPVHHWDTLPEARLIPSLLQEAPARTHAMLRGEAPSDSEAFLPEERDLGALAAAAAGCTACPLHARATQTVFGRGPPGARVVLVGEQPGDLEDRRGEPFVGPGGQKLDEVLAAVGIDRSAVYVTNAVKHFGWTGDEKRRIHAKPGTREIHACRGWLRAEIAAVRPRMVVALGATAGQSFLGPGFRLMRSRGQVFRTPWADEFLATWHPSALLRMQDVRDRARAEAEFRADLAVVAERLRTASASAA